MRTETIKLPLDILQPGKGIYTEEKVTPQVIRERVKRWQDKYDPDYEKKFKCLRVLQGYVIVRAA